MSKEHNTRITLVAVIGSILLIVILVGGTIWTAQNAHKDTADAARSVSLLYLDELAGRREQVVGNNLQDNIHDVQTAVGMLSAEDLSNLDHMRNYQRNMKRLLNLERFAFVDTDGLIYTADEGVRDEMSLYGFNHLTLSGPEIQVKNGNDGKKTVVIAMPIRDQNCFIDGKQLVACFTEQDMDVMLQGVSMTTQGSDTTFCNIYTADGVALTDTVLGGLAAEDNLLEALAHAEYDEGYSLEKVRRDFKEGNRGVTAFTYNGIRETLSYVPVKGTNWLLTYLVREKTISEQINSVSEGIVTRGVIQSVLTALVLGAMFVFIIRQNRKNTRLMLEKETSEAENRVKREEMEQRLALQEKLLEQQVTQDRQEKMITALASDYRSVYYLELDKDHGVCYQARADMHGFHEGDDFDYVKSVTEYCNHYVLPEYREDFLAFIQPKNIKEAL